MKKKNVFILLPLLALLAVAQSETPRVVEISAKKFEYVPNVVTLKKGQAVTLRVTLRSLNIPVKAGCAALCGGDAASDGGAPHRQWFGDESH